MVAVLLMGPFIMGTLIAFRGAEAAFQSAMTRTPLALSRVQISSALRRSVLSAGCILSPQAGQTQTVLSGIIGADCGGNGTATPSYFKYCLDSASSSLIFMSGTGIIIPAACSKASGYTLNSPFVTVSGSFSAGATLFQEITATLTLTVPYEQAQKDRWIAADNSVVWRERFSAPIPTVAP